MYFTVSVCNSVNEILELECYYSTIDDSLKNSLTFNFSKDRFYKVLFENELIGFGSILDEKYSFSDLKRFIHPQHRHKGAGELLLDFIIQDAISSNKTRVTGSFLGDNEKVVNFFSSKGFKINIGKPYSFVVLSLK